jgi:hypothetical protein
MSLIREKAIEKTTTHTIGFAAMWNRRPLNLVKFSKKIATKAAMSSAASSEVAFFENGVKKMSGVFGKMWRMDGRLVHQTLRKRSPLRWVDRQKIYLRLCSKILGSTRYYSHCLLSCTGLGKTIELRWKEVVVSTYRAP